jgi:hypothetical protein
MLNYDIDHSGAELSISGTHYDEADTPQEYDFVATAPHGSDSDALDCEIVKVLHNAGRQEFDLAYLKSCKLARIDARTDELVLNGFVYGGKTFSLEPDAKTLWLGMVVAKDMLTYPVRCNTVDDEDYVDLVDADAIVAFYATAMGMVKALEDSGTVLKDQVRAATTMAEVEAVEDNR